MRYFPYLRGKQEELLALHELEGFLSSVGSVCPILEPVNSIKRPERHDPLKAYSRQVAAGYPLAFITNPAKGDFQSVSEAVRTELIREHLASYSNFIPTLLVGPTTPPAEIDSFAATWTGEVGVVHAGMFSRPEAIASTLGGRLRFQAFRRGRTNQSYREQLSEGITVVLGDGFRKAERNSDYPEREFFSDLVSSHRREGYEGFGDFLTQGDHFAKGGGAAIAVAIHLTNWESDELWIRHFLSDRREGKGVDTPGKFLEALNKACRFIRSSENYLRTGGCQDLLELQSRSHFPGLGRSKRISLKHHLELVGTVSRDL